MSVAKTLFAVAAVSMTASTAYACPSLLDREYQGLQDGKTQSLCQFSDKVVLVVNTASHCGFTHQYEGLEALHQKYRDRGLVVVGFPSNDFGRQEPDDNQKIAEFCRTAYGIQFPMFEKTRVRGADADPLFRKLAERSGQPPSWNFHKYLIDRDGRSVASFASIVAPLSSELQQAIVARLAGRTR